MDKLLFTPTEAAATLGISRSRIYLFLSKGTLPCVRVGRSVRIPASALQEWVAQQILNPSAASSRDGDGR